MKTFVQDGQTIIITAGADITAGTPVTVSGMVAVAVDDIANGETGVGLASGVVTLPKVSADVIAQGDIVYLSSAGKITTTASTNAVAGKAWVAAGNGVLEVDVKLNV
jgi:predicted RecA/RadA family phage recombinase